jgi:Flp pilus assembly protein TadD
MRLKPDDAKARNNLAIVFGKQRQIDAAIRQY